ncbi:Pycsar system effector family protein [Sphaerisporangium sp. NPDC051017]|uniref:Pycsar system effector family protein n=1 Tax=Sphaerisporangium sp. NPDC051017 TaxID=3154636 RepID=UPI00344850CE
MLRRLAKAPAPSASAVRKEAETTAYAYAAKLLVDIREEINRADAKAQVLLGVSGVGLGAVAGGLFAGDWAPARLSNAVEWLWWAGVTAALASLACLAGAVYPRTGAPTARDSKVIAYYGDIVRFESVPALASALIGAAKPDLRQISDQVHRLSRIAYRKYLLIRWGFWLLAAAVVSTIASVVIDHFL